jgi:hypothetical protein
MHRLLFRPAGRIRANLTFSAEATEAKRVAEATLAEALRLRAGDRAIAEGRDIVTADDIRAVLADAMADVAAAITDPGPDA